MSRRPAMAEALLDGRTTLGVLDLGLAAAAPSASWAALVPPGGGLSSEAAAMRIVDLRDVYDELRKAVVEVWQEPGGAEASPLLTDARAEWWEVSKEAPWPFIAQPMISMVGWYQMDEDFGVAVLPVPDAGGGGDEYQLISTSWSREENSLLELGQRALVQCGPDGWSVQLRTWPCSTAEQDDELAAMGPDAWEDRLARELDGGGVPGNAMARHIRDALIVLVANSIVLADRTVAVRRRTPEKLRRANARRGRGRGRGRGRRTTAEFVWLDLPDLRYRADSGTFTAQRGGGVAWHMVRGHWRTLTAERYTRKGGQKVWVRPHARGAGPADGGGAGYRVVSSSA